jgi:hypothetical protein
MPKNGDDRPTEYLPTPDHGMPAVPWDQLIAYGLKPIDIKDLKKEVGTWIYVETKCDDPSHKDPFTWGCLGKVISASPSKVRVHLTNSTMLTCVPEKKDDIYLDFNFKKDQQVCISQCHTTEADSIQEPEESSETANEVQIKKILQDKTLNRNNQAGNEKEKRFRAEMILKAIQKAKTVNPERNWPLEEHELGGALSGYVEEAMKEAYEEDKTAKLGNCATNCGIAARIFSTESNKSNSNENTQLAQQLKMQGDQISKLAKMLELFMTEKTSSNTASVEEQKEPAAPRAEILSMPIKDGRCAHQLAGLLYKLLKVPLGDPSQLAEKEGEKQVEQAKALVLENCIKINQELEKVAREVDGEHFASAQWKEILGQSAQEIVARFVEDKDWGGAVELALAMWATELDITIIHGDLIYKGVTDTEILGAVHQASLKEFVEGEKKKTKWAIAILNKGHYHLAAVNHDNKKQVIFEQGDEFDKALKLTIEELKANQEVPPAKLRGPDLTSWAQKAAAGAHKPAGGQITPKKPIVQIKPSLTKPPSPETLCWHYEKFGKCNHGEKCKFKHDDSDEGKERRKISQSNQEIKKLQADVERMKKKLEDQNSSRSSAQSRGRKRSRTNKTTRSRSNSRSRDNSRPRSRASSRSRTGEGAWFEVSSSERELRVKLGKTRPAAWRKSLPEETSKLVTWVEEKSKDGWAVVKCDLGSEAKLFKLLNEDPDYEIQRRRRRSRRSGEGRK